MTIKFTKMHAAGNDFIVISEVEGIQVPEEEKPQFVAKYARRHFGIGSDGVIFIQKSEVADLKFHFFNPDGSIAEMCGNGIRCLAKYAYENKLMEKDELHVETLAGILTLNLEIEDGLMKSVTVDMGKPKIQNKDIPLIGEPEETSINRKIMVDGIENTITTVSMGNPHAIIFQEKIDDIDVKTTGSRIRNHKALFPKGINVHFISKAGENEFNIRTYERGVEDETLACGTGICASAVAAILTEKADSKTPITFHAKGGDLEIQVEMKEDTPEKVYMSGNATTVFQGELKTQLQQP